MKPIEFKEHNKIYAKDQEQYLPLPVYKDDSDEGNVISCWKLTWWERIKILFTGKMWWSQFTFHLPLQPQRPSVNKWDMLNKEYFNKNGEQ